MLSANTNVNATRSKCHVEHIKMRILFKFRLLLYLDIRSFIVDWAILVLLLQLLV